MATDSGTQAVPGPAVASAPAPAAGAPRSRPAWLPGWSGVAGLRALRAALVIPGLFAICFHVIGNLQMATFAAFGGFATLLFAAFRGSRRDVLVAHLMLAVGGSVLVVIGTAVSSSTALAALVTVPVAFVVLFGGVAGPNAASGANAALLAFVLPAASTGTMSMVPDRLAGWWMASIAGTIAVLVLSPRPVARQLIAAAADTSAALADQLNAALNGTCTAADREASIAAKQGLLDAFIATPYKPTGLAAPDQALGSLVGLLEWATASVCDSLREYTDLRAADPIERALLAATSDVLRDIAGVLRGGGPIPDLTELEVRLAESVEHVHGLRSHGDGFGDAVHLSFHARTVAVVARTAALDAMVASRRADRQVVADQRSRWIGLPDGDARSSGPLAGVLGASSVAVRHASVRSAWFRTSVRGAIALAAAVAVADLTGVQHGFWVVLGTLSVLRTSAVATGATAMRALVGTVAGFAIGAVLILAIGTDTTALWVTLPIAVLVAGYAPGVAPFAAGQAAFTVVVSVLFNLLVPAGWKIGALRLEDVALGCAVSFVVGVLFWPRGAASVVGDDLADSFRDGGAYLVGAVAWALGQQDHRPDAVASMTASLRLEDALRGFLAEQGTKAVPKQDLWRLVSGTTRLRLTAYSLAGLPHPNLDNNPVRLALNARAGELAHWYGDLATQVGHADPTGVAPLPLPADYGSYPLDELATEHLSCTVWVGEHLKHLTEHLADLTVPAAEVAERRTAPWWKR